MAEDKRYIGSPVIKDIDGSNITIGDIITTVVAKGNIIVGDSGSHSSPKVEIPQKTFEPEMITIQAGPFRMGSQLGPGIPEEETPAHVVELPEYQIGKFPIKQKQFFAFTKDTGKVEPSLGWPGFEPATEYLECPVHGVSWFLALEYCTWLFEKTGRNYTLPTEAEWEKAARGLDGLLYPWGNEWKEDCYNVSPYGVYDMVGNVREWTCSLWGTSPRQPDLKFMYIEENSGTSWTPNNPRNDLKASSQIRRVYRGGAVDRKEEMRSTLRRANLPETKIDLIKHGLRVVRRF